MAFKVNEFRAHFSKYGEFAKSDKFDVSIAVPTMLANYGKTEEMIFQCEIAELPGRTINTVDFVHYGFTERRPHFTSYEPIMLTFYCNGELTEKKFLDAWMELLVASTTGLANYDEANAYASKVTITQYSQYDTVPDRENEKPSFNKVLKETATRAALDIGKAAVEKAVGVPFGGLEQIYGIDNDKQWNSQIVRTESTPRPVYQCILENAMPVAMSPLSLSWADDSVLRLQVTFVYKKWSTNEMKIETLEGKKDAEKASSLKDKLRKRGKEILGAGVDYGVNRGIAKTTDIVLGKIKF